jgi:hypothetical protein
MITTQSSIVAGAFVGGSGPAGCEEADLLLQAWSVAAEIYAGTLVLLARKRYTISADGYARMYRNVMRGFVESENARLALDAHCAGHGCHWMQAARLNGHADGTSAQELGSRAPVEESLAALAESTGPVDAAHLSSRVLEEFLSNSLSPHQREDLSDHLHTCAPCRAACTELRQSRRSFWDIDELVRARFCPPRPSWEA